jgi:thiol-disulfide isomerase/thioredoxin
MGAGISASRITIAVLLLSLQGNSGPANADDESPAVPRYRLAPGQELAYRSEYRSDRKGGEARYLVDWNVWVIDREPEGAWRLVLRCTLKMMNASPPGHPAADRVDTLVWQCRLFDDGRLVGATTMGTVRDPFRLFPRLPDDAEALERGWDSTGAEKDQVRFQHRMTARPGPDDPAFTIATSSDSPLDKVYRSTQTARTTFDPRRGLVTQVETEFTTGYGAEGTTRGTIELASVEDRGPEWANTFGRDADAYFAAVNAYESATARALRDAGRCREILAEGKTKLEEARAAITDPIFREAIDPMLDRHDSVVTNIAEHATEREARLGTPAADWEAEDLKGATHRLADYRGKVVVMDFWYRGCGWCMFAMPQVNRLAETFRDDPVAVLGMTTDENEEDARVVAEAMALRYPVIKARDLPEKYGVEGYPTLIVVDRSGKVREFHVGYSPRLFEDLSSLIRELLAEETAKGCPAR